MKILFLNPAGQLGGAERSLLDLVASIQNAYGSEVELGLIAAGEGPFVEEARRLGVQVFILPLGAMTEAGDSGWGGRGRRVSALFDGRLLRAAGAVPSYAYRLRGLSRAFAPDVVHSNGIKTHILGALVRGRAPLVWHVRDFIGLRPVVRWAMRALAFRADAAIAISEAVADDARLVLPRLPVTVVHNAIDVDVFTPVGPVADLDALAGTEAAEPVTLRVGLVATYAHWKGHDVFLNAASRVASGSGSEKVRFYVVGGAIYETAESQYSEHELRALARQLGIAHCVRFVPFQRRVEDVYRALDVVVHASSRPEPFGRTIVEGMATGRPVIAPLEGGSAELFADGVEAIGVPPRSPEALARAILDLVGRPERRTALGQAARRAAVTRFSRARLGEQVFRVYREAGVALEGAPRSFLDGQASGRIGSAK
jgi:glycosyltransferase involved in cell wall biosynthesis